MSLPALSDEEDNRELFGEDCESDEGQSGQEQGEAEGDGETKGRVEPPKKVVIRNPQPKLNTERLKGPKGIHTIEKYFEGFKFHGKGHEKVDLDRIMKRLEHWSHRLFPKLHFNDFIARLESLGTKKDLQVHMKRYRLDMMIEDVEVRIEDDSDEKEEETGPGDEFDKLIAEQIEKQKQPTSTQVLNNSTHMPLNVTGTQRVYARKSTEGNAQNLPVEMTDEMKARIERNRQAALQRRQERIKAAEDAAKRKRMEELQNSQEAGEPSQDTDVRAADTSTDGPRESILREEGESEIPNNSGTGAQESTVEEEAEKQTEKNAEEDANEEEETGSKTEEGKSKAPEADQSKEMEVANFYEETEADNDIHSQERNASDSVVVLEEPSNSQEKNDATANISNGHSNREYTRDELNLEIEAALDEFMNENRFS